MQMIFESDNETLVKVLTTMEQNNNLYVGNIIKGIQFRQHRFRKVDFSHVGRKGNGPDHKLAHHALSEPNKIWPEETPSCILIEVLWDLFNQ